MASMSKASNGHWMIQLMGTDGKRKSIRIGKMPKSHAEVIHARIEDLASSKVSGRNVRDLTSEWVRDLGDGLRSKLERAGLLDRVEVREDRPDTLGPFLDWYRKVKSTDEVKSWTSRSWVTNSNRLVEFFGHGRKLTSIDGADAEEWRGWLVGRKYAEATIARTVKYARTFFQFAIKARIIESNPFADLKAGSYKNPDRQKYIDRETIDKVLDACPDAEWRLIVALCRFAGLRCPSEIVVLKWEDVLWDSNRFRIDSPKTGERFSPIHADLRTYLDAQWERATGEYVIEKYRDPEKNLRTPFTRIVRRAGLVPWERLFHNLRASCQTDLSNRFPGYVVCKWLGNSERIANDHYNQVTDDHFKSAAFSAALNPGRKSSEVEDSRNEPSTPSTQVHGIDGVSLNVSGEVVDGRTPDIGHNRTRINRHNAKERNSLGKSISEISESAALSWVVERWETLSSDTKSKILDLVDADVSIDPRSHFERME